MQQSTPGAWQKIAVFYAIVGPPIGSLVFATAYLVDRPVMEVPEHWLDVVSFALFAAAMGIGVAFIPAFAVGASYALLVVRRGNLQGTVANRICLSLGIGLAAGALLGVTYGSMPLFLSACGMAAAACAGLLERCDYFEWLP